MIFERIFRAIDKIDNEIKIKNRKLKRKYSFLTLENIFVVGLLVIFSFLISGGIASIYTGATQQLVSTGYSSNETYIEFVIYFIIHISYVISLYTVYISLKKPRIDTSLLSIGIALFFLLFAVEWYIISFVRGAPI